MNTEMQQIEELQQDQIETVAGGYDDIPYCGTLPRRFPFPLPPVVIPGVISGPRRI